MGSVQFFVHLIVVWCEVKVGWTWLTRNVEFSFDETEKPLFDFESKIEFTPMEVPFFLTSNLFFPSTPPIKCTSGLGCEPFCSLLAIRALFDPFCYQTLTTFLANAAGGLRPICFALLIVYKSCIVGRSWTSTFVVPISICNLRFLVELCLNEEMPLSAHLFDQI